MISNVDVCLIDTRRISIGFTFKQLVIYVSVENGRRLVSPEIQTVNDRVIKQVTMH